MLAMSRSSALCELYALVSRYWPLILFACLTTVIIRRRFFSPLSKYPGPFLASFNRIHKFVIVASGKAHSASVDLHKKYGPFVRVTHDEISVASAKAALEVVAPGRGSYKTDFYSVFPPDDTTDVFTERDEKLHSQIKRVAGVPYAMQKMREMTNTIDEISATLLQKLDHFTATSGVVDLGEWLHFFAFDVIGRVAFSTDFGFLDQGYDIDNTIQKIALALRYGVVIGQMPILDRVLRRNPVLSYIPFWKRKDLMVAAKATDQVQQRRPFVSSKLEQKKELLGRLIQGHLANPERFGEEKVSAVAIGAIFAGSDSTSSTMQSFFYYLLRHKSVYDGMKAEIDEAQKAGRLSTFITYDEALDLPYFQAAFKESMRLRPAQGVSMQRHPPPQGITLQGHHLPGGTRLALSAWAIHRDEEIFGKDPEEYKPERWLGDPEKAQVMSRHMFHFGGGSHLCLGRNLALIEMNSILPQLLREYDFELITTEKEWTTKSWGFVVQSGLVTRIRKRRLTEELAVLVQS